MAKGKTTSKARLRATDISEVEKGLEAVRTEQITLGGPISEKPNEEIFYLDQSGMSAPAEIRAAKERRLYYKRPLRIDEILKPSSKLPPVIQGPSHGSGGMERRLIDRKARHLATAKPAEGNVKKPKVEVFDIWEGTVEAAPKRRHSEAPVKVAAVKVPKGGASYRPTTAEHEKLMEEAAAIEIAKEEAQQRLNALLPPVLLTGAATSTIDTVVQEALYGVSADGNASASEEEESISMDEVPSTTAQPQKKKSKKERTKEQKMRETQKRAEHEEREKKIANQLQSLKSIAKQVKAELAGNVKKQNKRDGKSYLAVLKRVNGGNAFIPVPMEVQLPEELADSLRTVKQEGNLVMDRFKSLQERALISTTPLPGSTKRRQKPKVRMVEPNSYKH